MAQNRRQFQFMGCIQFDLLSGELGVDDAQYAATITLTGIATANLVDQEVLVYQNGEFVHHKGKRIVEPSYVLSQLRHWTATEGRKR